MNAAPEGDDGALAARALGGDDRAFTELMRRHKNNLYRFVRGYVGDATEAYDLVQESFVAAWRALDKYDRARSFSVWLKHIAINRCRDWRRRRLVRAFFYAAQDIEGVQVADGEIPADNDTERELMRLDAAIAGLPQNLKEPLLLTLLDGLTHKQAGAALGLSAKAVELRIYRAKRALSKALGGRDDPD
jgi:RNA polymerase sigma-70 factor (ECF subfamily)